MSNMSKHSNNIYHRDTFLKNISDKLNRPLPIALKAREPLQYPLNVMDELNQDELKAAFIHYSIHSLGVNAVECTALQLTDYLDAQFNGYQSVKHTTDKNKVLLSSDERLLKLINAGGLSNSKYEVDFWDENITNSENIEIAEKATFGVVFAEQALVESGTIVLYSNPKQGRSISLLPECSIFIVPKSKLTSRLTQATSVLHQKAQQQERLPSCINFISGPSSTADIELIKVVGVHGPTYATYIVIDDM